MTKIEGAHRKAICSRIVSNNIVWARQCLSGGLLRLRVGPNVLTVLGLATTWVGAVFLALGAGDKVLSSAVGQRSWYGVGAGAILLVASIFDILDGVVARNTNRATRLGGFLDSCFDRVADAVIFVGITIYYLYHPEIPHADLFALLSVVALVNAELISYVKARAENFIDSCQVGYWQRGERMAAILIGLFCGHISTVVLLLAILPAFTVTRRLSFAIRQIKRLANNHLPLDPQGELQGIMRFALWRHRRGSLGYVLTTAINIAFIVFVDLQDILSRAVG